MRLDIGFDGVLPGHMRHPARHTESINIWTCCAPEHVLFEHGNLSVSDLPHLYFTFSSLDVTAGKTYVVGRQSAGDAFLNQLLARYPQDKLHVLVSDPRDADYFRAEFHPSPSVTIRLFGSFVDENPAGVLFNSDPRLSRFAQVRQQQAKPAYAITGISHTLSIPEILDDVQHQTAAAMYPCDALICTSACGKKVITKRIGELGEQATSSIRYPVIPLGIDADSFAPDPEKRDRGRSLRRQLNIPDETVVMLYLGRFSEQDKFTQKPFFSSIQHAVRRYSGDALLLMVGTASSAAGLSTIETNAQTFAPDVPVLFLDSRDDPIRNHVRYAADIFVSLVDHIQETFGLTPLEAMAAGLPVVVTDWNGYSETVVDGKTGYKIKTYWPDEPVSHDGMPCGSYSQEDAADALLRLLEQPDLRASLGSEGIRHVKQCYDWDVVWPMYTQLFLEQYASVKLIRSAGESKSITPTPIDYRRLFSHYVSDSGA